MVDPTETEIDAMLKAGQAGGEYLDSLGKSDMAQMTHGEWMTFIEAVITSYLDELRNTPPF